jgi:hypothetical protein
MVNVAGQTWGGPGIWARNIAGLGPGSGYQPPLGLIPAAQGLTGIRPGLRRGRARHEQDTSGPSANRLIETWAVGADPYMPGQEVRVPIGRWPRLNDTVIAPGNPTPDALGRRDCSVTPLTDGRQTSKNLGRTTKRLVHREGGSRALTGETGGEVAHHQHMDQARDSCLDWLDGGAVVARSLVGRVSRRAVRCWRRSSAEWGPWLLVAH